MSFTLQDIAWHRSVGQLVEALDAPDFWIRLVRLLEQYVPFDSWVALLFSQGRPQVFAECPGADGGPDPLFQDYLRGLYLLDPFYIASRENPCSGLFRLADVAPECFEQTDYYQRYFRLNVVADEIRSTSSSPANAPSACRSARGAASPRATRRARSGAALGGRADAPAPGLRGRSVEQPAAPEPGWQGSLEKVAEQMGTPLTARELEVGRLMLSGCSSKEIARKLAISAETVKVHRKHMYGKLGIKSQSELFGLFLQAQG